MKIIKDYRCNACGYTFETYLGKLDPSPLCHECGGQTTSIISGTSFTLPGSDSAGFPSAHAKWAKRRQQKMKEEAAQGITPMGQSNL